tara:strand:+ start:97 stop:225 length:129 start_codon:yes stop_codon:yes gene_type:complete
MATGRLISALYVNFGVMLCDLDREAKEQMAIDMSRFFFTAVN